MVAVVARSTDTVAGLWTGSACCALTLAAGTDVELAGVCHPLLQSVSVSTCRDLAVAGTAARDGDSVFGVCHSSTGLTHSVGAARALCACEEAFAACGACLAGVGLAFSLNEVVFGGTSVNLAVTCTGARDVLVCGTICDWWAGGAYCVRLIPTACSLVFSSRAL